jgi:2-succinyl-5-enolpyruvyl-6-hydroxy-3-cyclohexene-1-carboxylate synthase
LTHAGQHLLACPVVVHPEERSLGFLDRNLLALGYRKRKPVAARLTDA